MDDQINFRFVGIQILSKNLLELPTEKIDTSNFNFKVKVEIRVKAENKLVIPFVDITIKNSNEEIEFAKIKLAFLFEVEDFEDKIKLNEEGVYIVPKHLESILSPVSISTARGIVYSEFRGTYLHGAIMPVIFMNQLKEESTK